MVLVFITISAQQPSGEEVWSLTAVPATQFQRRALTDDSQRLFGRFHGSRLRFSR